MDDSELDFVDLYSKLLKRVRKKAGHPPSSQASDGDQRGRNNKQSVASGSKPAELLVGGGTGPGSGDAGSSVVASTGLRPERDLTAKDTVLDRMQQFRRASPQRMVHRGQPTNNHEPLHQESLESFASGLNPDPQDSDKALALLLQQELDREAAEAQTVELGDGGLFFCQICHKDLSHMSTEGRTQHLNRCLDAREESARDPRPPPPPPGVLECPICGKKFKSPKSRSAHLKRCSAEMGVAPVLLLQALQRQAEETQNVSTMNTIAQTGCSKRKGPSKPGLPARKKARKKTGPLDEDTVMALALSSSLLEREQQRESKAELQIQAEAAVHPMAPLMKWKPDLGKGRGRKRKGPVRRPPPLLLVQDAQEALKRLQERVSALLLHSWPDSPPTPTRSPSRLPGRTGAAPLWQKSALLDCSTGPSDFYTPELRQFITPWEPKSNRVSCNKPDPPLQQLNEGTHDTESRAPIPPPSSQTASCSSAPSTPGTRHEGIQALRNLMELAEDSMTLTQCGYAAHEHNQAVRLSGFVLEEAEEQDVHCVSGFIPETTRCETQRKSDGSDKECDRHQSVALSRLAADLGSMVNNPQLSDVQIQVDSGDVYFAHSFMVYARCPLLAEMVYEGGFGVQEDGSPAAQRVLMSDVPGQAVFALLQYLYTGSCTFPASLQPHVLELASRFDLQELRQRCELHRDEADGPNQTDQAFMELLRSMWNEEDEGEEETDTDGAKNEQSVFQEQWGNGLTSGDREIIEEKVNEEELDEIYEFAATQRNRGTMNDSEEEEEAGGDAVNTKNYSSDRSPKLKSNPETGRSLDRSYSRLFSESWGVYEEGESSSSQTHPPRSQPHCSFHKPSSNLSGRALLQSSASVVGDVSLSPPPTTANLPFPGVSPGQVGDCGVGGEKKTDAAELEWPTLQTQSRGPHNICVSLSPHSPQNNNKEEPEVIVLSDSSEEMEVAHCTTDTKTYTQIKSQQKLNEPTCNKNESISLDLSPGDPVDGSPELSWLIPSTPAQRETSSSSQTRSSMCRTQLFPSSHPCVFSSPATSDGRLQTSNSLHGVSNLTGLREGGVSREKGVRSRSNLDLNCSPKRPSSCVPPVTPVHLQPQPYSSTPLDTQVHKPPGHLTASPFHTGPKEQTGEGREQATSESLEKTELGSFHPSPLSDPLDQPSQKVSFHRSRISSQKQMKSFGEMGRNEVETGDQEEAKGESGEAGSPECTWQQSFMDEPPIAFNDSWGLDACGEANPGCFSLRLEDSRGSSQQDGSLAHGGTTRSSSSSNCHPPPSSGWLQASKSCDGVVDSSPSSIQVHTSTTPQINNSLLDSKIWDSWEEEEEEEEAAPLSQRVNPSAHLRTPTSSLSKKRRSLVPITPMPHYSDMDTPELKSKLNRFGVRPLPKRQMILKLKEIHQYTHQLVGSDSEDEPPLAAHAAPTTSLATSSAAAPIRLVSCSQTVTFKEPSVPVAKPSTTEEEEPLSASQGSNTSSTAASEESDRSNPELCLSSGEDSDGDGGISASQAANRLQDRLRAVRSFILSDSALYTQILQYQPLVLSQLQQRLKATGIRLGGAKLVDYLDSQCVTFTTAKPGRPAPSRRRGTRTGRGAKAAGESGARRKKAPI